MSAPRCIVGEHPVLARMIDLEMAAAVERWHFVGDAVHILLAVPRRGCACGQLHAWFVNRDGRTRCCECDAAWLAERAALARVRAGELPISQPKRSEG